MASADGEEGSDGVGATGWVTLFRLGVDAGVAVVVELLESLEGDALAWVEGRRDLLKCMLCACLKRLARFNGRAILNVVGAMLLSRGGVQRGQRQVYLLV